ncbi:hypothetical protein HBH98_183040 [Parastagonospora nodorum]|nr:hypothetical protein HBH98_183040 [Parastagonospora nodorum]KAH4893426.1 hypothetical protein HBI80_246690 [Parastagonospora nodorum]KAH5099094.1 hypothetical protein HBH71_237540 [Parastagonospora nodorum]KAH5396032.1 hypothetical protein HBI47_228740 [Parastagonospora nodorum]KAH5706162.1 hypothetical protein HBI20_222680 [Parastagonospora nodorum]
MAKRARSRSPSRSPIHLRPRANLSPDRYKVAEHIASTLREDRTYVDRLRSREESEDEETEERSHETARRRSDARAVRRNEPLKRHIARNAPHPNDLSVQELKRLLAKKTKEEHSATNELSPFSKPDTDVQGGAKWRIIAKGGDVIHAQIIAKGGDIATERFQIPRTDIAAKRLLFPTWLEEFCELSRFGRWTRHNHLGELWRNHLLENFINEKKRNRRYGL